METAIALLKAHGYREASHPLPIGSANFSFDAVLTADRSLDLIVLSDTTIGNEERFRRQILALSRALDVIRSRRTLTVILVGQQLSAEAMESLMRVCRVLPVGTLIGPNAESTLRDWLAVLLPLRLPDADNIQSDWRAEVTERLPRANTRSAIAYLGASEAGGASVREELRRRVQAVLDSRAGDIGA
ncbi:hypothetical protein C7W88_04555 [Novosphingobium sp. THN1]|uniref:hypothetical protein n=1 Tax=Novosphingobium sp. THN1 TaxID=1016987 RepID=UPI000E4C852E|nr:hypothetical protein [Novosphingobium sp. THN1]AXU18469.1 hypothetical protein C7W88_04555 [Novosphingobium sp. THN1]